MVTEDNRRARRRAWVAAANAFIQDLEADVVCPGNGDAKLRARFVQARPDAPGGELITTCPGCGAETAVRLPKGLRPTISEEARARWALAANNGGVTISQKGVTLWKGRGGGAVLQRKYDAAAFFFTSQRPLFFGTHASCVSHVMLSHGLDRCVVTHLASDDRVDAQQASSAASPD